MLLLRASPGGQICSAWIVMTKHRSELKGVSRHPALGNCRYLIHLKIKCQWTYRERPALPGLYLAYCKQCRGLTVIAFSFITVW